MRLWVCTYVFVYMCVRGVCVCLCLCMYVCMHKDTCASEETRLQELDQKRQTGSRGVKILLLQQLHPSAAVSAHPSLGCTLTSDVSYVCVITYMYKHMR